MLYLITSSPVNNDSHTLLFWFLRKQGIYAPTGQWRRFLIQLVIAVAVMFVALLMLSAELGLLQSEVWQQGNWLQRSWRPLVMLAFVILLIIRWTGISQHPIDLSLELKLMDIIELGLGGYVVGRSVEKVASTVTQNIDIPFIKKKNR